MASILLIVVGAIVLVLLVLLWRYSYWYRRGVPQGNPLKLFADLNDIMLSLIPFWEVHIQQGRRYADKAYFGGYSFTSPRLFIRDSNMVKAILTSKFSSFSENGFAISEDLEPIIGRDPFFQKGGEKWKESRAHFSSLMTPSRLRVAMLPEIAVVSAQAISYLKDQKNESGKGDGVNVKDFGVRYMTDILVRVLLSLEAGSFKDDKNPFLHQAQHLFKEGVSSYLATIFTFFAPQLGKILKLSFLTEEVQDFFNHFVQEQKRYRNENGIKRDDILELITKKAGEVKNTKSDGKPDDADIEALALIIMFFMEGFETTSTTIATTLACLAKHEEIQENLRREVLQACPIGKEVTEEAINSMTLLQNCVTEALRLYPPGFVLQRVVTEDVTLEAKNGEELSLKKGEIIMVPIAALHYDPENFPDPENFDPARFEDETQKRTHLGFGDGPRQCPGQKFAALSMKVILAMIFREFKLELSPKTKYPLEPLSNHPILFTLKDVGVRFIPL